MYSDDRSYLRSNPGTPRSSRSIQPVQSTRDLPLPAASYQQPSHPQQNINPDIIFDGLGENTMNWLLAREKLTLVFTIHECWDILKHQTIVPSEPKEEDFTTHAEKQLFDMLAENHHSQVKLFDDEIKANPGIYTPDKIRREHYELHKDYESKKFSILIQQTQRKANYLLACQEWRSCKDSWAKQTAHATAIFTKHITGPALDIIYPSLLQLDVYTAWQTLDHTYARDRSELLSIISRMAYHPYDMSCYDFCFEMKVIFIRLEEIESPIRPVSEKMKLDSIIHAIRNGSYALFRDFLTQQKTTTSYPTFLQALEEKVQQLLKEKGLSIPSYHTVI